MEIVVGENVCYRLLADECQDIDNEKMCQHIANKVL